MAMTAAKARREILDIVAILRGMIRSKQTAGLLKASPSKPSGRISPDYSRNPILFQRVRVTVKDKKKCIFSATSGERRYSKSRQLRMNELQSLGWAVTGRAVSSIGMGDG
jgi:hypothetical protein